MYYEPLKDRVAVLVRRYPAVRSAFYWLLDLLLLRQRYVKRCLLRYGRDFPGLHYYDAGAGFCQYSWFVLRRFPSSTVLATDLKGGYLEDFFAYSKAKFPGRFTWQSADLQLYTPPGRYHVATAIDILEHIPDDDAVMANFLACLEPGGVLIISTPSDSDEAARFTSEHVRPGYDKAALESKLRIHGFEIMESIYSYGKMGSLAWRLLLKHPMALMQKTILAVLLLPLYYLFALPLAQILMWMDLRRHNITGTGIIIVARKPA